MIDLFFLKTFIAVTKTKSFRIAAERNHITQPAVSQHIQIIEKKLGASVLERHGKRITLTSAGKIFLPFAENILSQYEEAKTRVHEIHNNYAGTIRIATIYSIGLYNLRVSIRKFFKKYPQIDLHLEYQQSLSIYEMLFNQTIDFGLVAYHQEKNGITSEIFLEDTLVFVQPVSRPIFTRKRPSLKDCHKIKFIAFSPLTPTGKVINQFLLKKQIQPEIIHEYDNVELIKSAVLLGLGCAVLPKSVIGRELRERTLEIMPVEGFHLKRPLYILHLKKKQFTNSAKAFLGAITASHQTLTEPALRV